MLVPVVGKLKDGGLGFWTPPQIGLIDFCMVLRSALVEPPNTFCHSVDSVQVIMCLDVLVKYPG